MAVNIIELISQRLDPLMECILKIYSRMSKQTTTGINKSEKQSGNGDTTLAPASVIMKIQLPVAIACLATFLLSCNSQPGSAGTAQSTKTSISIDTPQSFLKNYGVNDNNHLFVFVGEKISVTPLPHERGLMDIGFIAKYSIIKKVYGHFAADTIEFVAYDHYGTPAFSKFKNVLLYVSADSGMYYHQKYLYNDVYKTKDGRWAGPYAQEDYEDVYNKRTKIKPINIDFSEKAAYPTRIVDEQGKQQGFAYPEPYYKTKGDSAFIIYGNYIEELFSLKRTGVLTIRGLFEATAEQEEDMVESWQPEPPKTPPGPDDLKFLSFWKVFVASLNEPDLKKFKNIALDTLYVCDEILSTGDFIDKCFAEVIDVEVRKRIIDRTKLEYKSDEIEFTHLVTSNSRKEIEGVGHTYRTRRMLVTRSTKNDNPPTIYFEFIETKRGYRLYRIDHHWSKECCQSAVQ